MKTDKIFFRLHKTIEAKELKDITQSEMAEKIGVSHSAYRDYRSGINQPLALKALLEMLNLVDDDEIIKIVRMWKDNEENK